MPDLGFANLDPSQTRFLFTIAQPYLHTGQWPTWDYVHAVHQRRGEDADVLLDSLPYSGNTGTGSFFYGFTTRAGRLQPDEKIGLTVAAALPVHELQSIIAEPFLRVLHHMIDLQTSIPLEPGRVTQARLDSRELTTALPGLRADFVARLPDLLDREPSTRAVGAAGASRNEQGWSRGITRTVLDFRATDLRTYVSSACALVLKWEQQHVATFGIRSSVPFTPPSAAPEPVQSAATVISAEQTEADAYIAQPLLDELQEAGEKSRWKVDKLLDLLGELNSNYASRHPYSCLALIRAVMDHVPSLFKQPKFIGVVSSVKMSETDSRYLKALAGYRFPGDDVMHRQASNIPTRIDMTDVPPALYIKALLNQVLIALRNDPL